MQHPIDRLAEINAHIRLLRREARDIKAQLLNGDISARGQTHTAAVYKRVVLTPIQRVKAAQPLDLSSHVQPDPTAYQAAQNYQGQNFQPHRPQAMQTGQAGWGGDD